MANLGYIQVTRQCNQSCRFCSNPPLSGQRSAQEVRALVDDLRSRGYDGVILTGGEPTLEPNLAHMIACCREAGLPVRMITNGTRTCQESYLDELIEAGLTHCHLSLHSHRAQIHGSLTGNGTGWDALVQTLNHIESRQSWISVDINTVITSENCDHLHELAAFVTDSFPWVRHFVFNALDPDTDRLRANAELIPALADMELSLIEAARLIEGGGRTLRVERVPLCYLPAFEHCSTETRKRVKAEERLTHFLDNKQMVHQGPEAFVHSHFEPCQPCTLKPICAGLYDRERGYDPSELAPQFVAAAPIKERILS